MAEKFQYTSGKINFLDLWPDLTLHPAYNEIHNFICIAQ